MKIGLLGEAPFDTNAIRKLLEQKYSDGIQYFVLLNGVNGSNLDNKNMIRRIRREYELERPNFIIYCRDLDSLKSDRAKILERKINYRTINNRTDRKTIFLLNIFELEVLLFSDLETTNKHYNSSIQIEQAPIDIIQPKEELKKKIKNYNQYDVEVFSKLNHETLKLMNPIFDTFIKEFEQNLNSNKN